VKDWKGQIAIMLLGFIEKLIPAFFVHFNNRLRAKKEKAESNLRLAKYETAKLRLEKDHGEKNSDKSDLDVIDDFLDPSNPPDSQPPEGDASK